MRKGLLLVAMAVVLLLTIGGVVVASSYKTQVDVQPLGGSSNGGYYTLKVKVLINYGYFGGTQPLGDAVVWVYGNGFHQNFTASDGVAMLLLPAGNYTVFVTQLHYKIHVEVNQNEEIVLNYAYLVS